MASVLVAAFKEIESLRKECEGGSESDYFQMAMGDPFAQNGFGLSAHKCLLMVDPETGAMIAKAAKLIICDRLVALGVELD